MGKQNSLKLKNNKRELFYVILLFVLFEFAVIAMEQGLGQLYRYIGIVAAWLTLNWSLFAYIRHSRKKVSSKTNTFIEIKMVERVFPYFITPLILVAAMYVNLYLDKSAVMRQLVIIAGTFYLWSNFVHIKNSYKEFYSIAGFTRVIFKFTDIFLFYLMVNSAYLLPLDVWIKIVLTISSATVLFMHQLRLYKQKGSPAYIVLALSSSLITAAAILCKSMSPLVVPLILSIIFYGLVGVWYVRLSGSRKFVDYLNPILFALMALIVVLSF